VVLPARKPQRAKDFVSTARFGPSSSGSYVFTVHVPLPDAASEGSLFADTPELDVAPEPFARQVSRRLYESVAVARAAAALAEEADDSSPFAAGLEEDCPLTFARHWLASVGTTGVTRRPGMAFPWGSVGRLDGRFRTRLSLRSSPDDWSRFSGQEPKIFDARSPIEESRSWAAPSG